MAKAIEGEIYRHNKSGGHYIVAYLATNEADEVPVVVYRATYGDRRIWVRPVASFEGLNDAGEERFSLLTDELYI